MRHVCIVMHGIEYQPDIMSWVQEFVLCLQPYTAMQLYPQLYGHVSGIRAWWFGLYRQDKVDKQVAELKAEYARITSSDCNGDPNAKISVFAHSLGGTIVEAALKDGGIKFHNIILMMAAAHEDIDWHRYDHNFNHIYVYWSPKDEVLPWSYWGKLGLVGPLVTHERVTPIETDWLHNEFEDDWFDAGLTKPQQFLRQLEAD